MAFRSDNGENNEVETPLSNGYELIRGDDLDLPSNSNANWRSNVNDLYIPPAPPAAEQSIGQIPHRPIDIHMDSGKKRSIL